MDPFHSYKGPLCPLREVGTYDNDTAALEQKLSWRPAVPAGADVRPLLMEDWCNREQRCSAEH